MFNFVFKQDCTPVAWDGNDELVQQQKDYEQTLHEHYGLGKNIERAAQREDGDAINRRAPFIPSPGEDLKVTADKEHKVTGDDEENFDERAPFIPLSFVDSGLDCEDDLLVEIPFIDSPMTPSPTSWLFDADQSIPSPESMFPPTTQLKRPPTFKKPQSLSASSSPVLSRKDLPAAIKRNSYVTNDLPSKGKSFFPGITQWDAEVNAPVQTSSLLQGEELLKALECGDFI